MPKYTNKEIMRQRILTAIRYCGEIDTDWVLMTPVHQRTRKNIVINKFHTSCKIQTLTSVLLHLIFIYKLDLFIAHSCI